VLPYGVAMIGNSVATVRLTWVLVVLGVWSGCGSATVDTSPSSAAVPTTVPAATELAESQITANTVTPPPTPGPCDPTDIEVVPEPAADADQVIGLINRGDVVCEVDVSGSPDASENLEPNVVLGTGEVAHLWVSELAACERGQPDPATEFELRVNGASRIVPLTFAAGCGVELWAFFTD
jgi:hypothetical protein